MKIITITNQKGGVAKTTTAYALASGLYKKGFKVLGIDTDPQANFTYSCGAKDVSKNLYEVFKEKVKIKNAIQKSNIGFDYIPSTLNLAMCDLEFQQVGNEHMLKNALEPIKNNYDYIIIDTPPTLTKLTVNSLTACDSVIIPMSADVYSLQGLGNLLDVIDTIQQYTNKNLYIEGILITKFNGRAVIDKKIRQDIEEVGQKLNINVFNTNIRSAVAIKENQYLQADMFKSERYSKVVSDYTSFINELLEKGGK